MDSAGAAQGVLLEDGSAVRAKLVLSNATPKGLSFLFLFSSLVGEWRGRVSLLSPSLARSVTVA